MSNPLAIVGDIHGDVTRLQRALATLTRMARNLIFVGDYINRGPNSREVITELITLQETHPRTVFLRGNHEAALLRWLDGGTFESFLQHGGLTTIASYIADPGPGVFTTFRETYPLRHRKFLESTRTFYEVPGLFVSHAGYDPSQPARRDETLVNGRHLELFDQPGNRPQDLVVFGHYVQPTGQPYDRDGIACIDTGCGVLDGGPLTALLLPEHTYVQF